MTPIQQMIAMRKTWCPITRDPKTVERIYYQYRKLWYEANKERPNASKQS